MSPAVGLVEEGSMCVGTQAQWETWEGVAQFSNEPSMEKKKKNVTIKSVFGRCSAQNQCLLF